MIKYIFRKKSMYAVLFILIITKYLSKQIYQTYPLQIDENEEEGDLNVMHIRNDDTICQKWVPSLLAPILLISSSQKIPQDYTLIKSIRIKYPILSTSSLFDTNIYYHSFIGKNEAILGRVLGSSKFSDCYLGLSNKITGFEELEIKDIFLNQLTKDKILSFDIWSINDKPITSSLYIGNSHEDFSSEKKKPNIGTCKSKKENLYWGCTFKGFYLKSKFLNLKKKENEYYTIYFSSDSYDIILPKSIEKDFDDLTDHSCTYREDLHGYEEYYLSCSNLFNEQDFEEIKLLGENFNITIEIDNKYRFINDKEEKKKKTRIRYEEEVDYFVFPLIMFKNFHIQFDGEKNLISFYTKNSSLIEVEKKENNNGSSKGLVVLIIILIIIIIIGLAFGVFWFIKKRNSPIERKINKYNKYDEDPNFQDLQGKKVF